MVHRPLYIRMFQSENPEKPLIVVMSTDVTHLRRQSTFHNQGMLRLRFEIEQALRGDDRAGKAA